MENISAVLLHIFNSISHPLVSVSLIYDLYPFLLSLVLLFSPLLLLIPPYLPCSSLFAFLTSISMQLYIFSSSHCDPF